MIMFSLVFAYKGRNSMDRRRNGRCVFIALLRKKGTLPGSESFRSIQLPFDKSIEVSDPMYSFNESLNPIDPLHIFASNKYNVGRPRFDGERAAVTVNKAM